MKDYKKWFEENFLDGDKIQEGQMLSASECLEAIKQGAREERERLRIQIEREVVDPLLDTSKKQFGTNEAIKALRDNLRAENN